MPGAMSVPTAYVPSLSMVVFAPGAGPGEAAGDGGGGVGSGSAPATPADAAQPATITPATTHRATTGAGFDHIENQRTGLSCVEASAARPAWKR